MRIVLLSVFVAGSVFAQHPNGGVWTGYVGGWKPNEPTVGPTLRGSIDLSGARRNRPQVVVMPYYVPVNVTQQQPPVDRGALEAERARAWDAEQARLAQQAQLETERRLAAERELALMQSLEAERRLAAEREAIAAQKLKLELEARALQVAALTPPPPPEPIKPTAPSTPGNDIYRWTDADGVTHYSTNVPASAKSVAKKVGGH